MGNTDRTLKHAKATAKVVATIRLHPDAWAWLGKQAKKQAISINKLLIEMVDKARGL